MANAEAGVVHEGVGDEFSNVKEDRDSEGDLEQVCL